MCCWKLSEKRERICGSGWATNLFLQRTLKSIQGKHRAVSSGKTTHGGSAKCTAELKLKYKLTEINTRVRINVYVWVEYSFVRFLYENLKADILCGKIHGKI